MPLERRSVPAAERVHANQTGKGLYVSQTLGRRAKAAGRLVVEFGSEHLPDRLKPATAN